MTSEGGTSRLQTTIGGRGTPGYRAPEILAERSAYSHKADVWSMGCILFELCTRNQAFKSDYFVSNFRFQKDFPVPFVDGISDKLKAILTTKWLIPMLQVDPKCRPSAKFVLNSFGSLITAISGSIPKPDIGSWSPEKHSLGTDGPVAQSAPFQWTQIFAPGSFDQYNRMLERYEGIVGTRIKALGLKHPATIWSITRLAWAYWHCGKFQQAEPLFKQIIKWQRTGRDDSFPQLWSTMYALAWCYYDQRLYDAAADMCRRSQRLQLQLLGVDHLDTVVCTAALIWMLYTLGKRHNLLQQLEQGLEKLTTFGGPDHCYTVFANHDLGDFHFAEHHYDIALSYYETAMKGCRRVFGMGHPHTARTLNKLCECFRRMGQTNVLLSEEALETSRRVLGRRECMAFAHMAMSFSAPVNGNGF